jgi:hypothetical protein
MTEQNDRRPIVEGKPEPDLVAHDPDACGLLQAAAIVAERNPGLDEQQALGVLMRGFWLGRLRLFQLRVVERSDEESDRDRTNAPLGYRRTEWPRAKLHQILCWRAKVEGSGLELPPEPTEGCFRRLANERPEGYDPDHIKSG